MKKTIKLSEAELTSIIKKVVKENKRDRHADLAQVISKLESEMGLNLENVDGDVVAKGKKLDNFLAKKLLELNSLHNELKASLLGIGVTTRELKGYGEDTKEF